MQEPALGEATALEQGIAMAMTEAEIVWARQIKAGVQKSENLRPVSDMDVAQMALASIARGDNAEVTMDNLYKMQCFREEYRIHDTLDEGMQLIRGFLDLLPGAILSIDYSAIFGNFIWTFDYAAFFPAKVKTPKEWRIFMGGTYYMLHCMCPTFHAQRGGLVQICECEGIGPQNIDLHMGEKWLHEILNFYPFIFKESMWLNTPMAMNVAYAVLKPMFTPQAKRNLRIGCKLDGYEGRIDALFKSPTPEIAKIQLLQRIEGYLRERFRNQSTFTLPEPQEESISISDDDGGEDMEMDDDAL